MTLVEKAIIANTCIQASWLVWVLFNHYKTDHKGEENE